jgi:hypothetical protein
MQFVPITDQQLEGPSFTYILKRTEAFPTTECACEKLFYQLPNLIGDIWHQMSDLMIIDHLMIETRII